MLSGAAAIGAAATGAEPVAAGAAALSGATATFSLVTGLASTAVKVVNGRYADAGSTFFQTGLGAFGSGGIKALNQITRAGINGERLSLGVNTVLTLGGGVPSMNCLNKR